MNFNFKTIGKVEPLFTRNQRKMRT